MCYLKKEKNKEGIGIVVFLMGQTMKPATGTSLSRLMHRPGNIRLGLGLTDS
jgi:hypothetical protein